uniref:Uncharacterized protein n=1 Tax=Buteo japonicus TaxID=224669 RepID=A0A8C0B2I5_9AVES
MDSQIRQNYHRDCEAAVNRMANMELGGGRGGERPHNFTTTPSVLQSQCWGPPDA